MLARTRAAPPTAGRWSMAVDVRRLASAAAWPGVVLLAVAVRGLYVLDAPFPLNDGGMFLQMTRDLRAEQFRLPEYTTYNGGEIPFAYPPGAFYLAGALDLLLPVSLLTLFRVLPLLGATATVVAFASLARTLLPSRRDAILATGAFALMPVAFAWLVTGGGLPRGIALALALLAVREAHLLVSEGGFSARRATTLGLLAGAVALLHLETAAFLGLSLLVLAACRPRPRFVRIAPAVVVAAAVCSPWIAIVLSRHGLDPFLASMDQGGALLDDGRISWPTLRYALLHPISTGEPEFPIIASLALAGAVLAVLRGRVFVPLWCLAIAVVAMRASPTFASAAVALLAGSALGGLFDAAAASNLPPRRRIATEASIIVLCGVFATSGAIAQRSGPAAALRPLPEGDRAAMAWIAEHTPADAKFAVIPSTGWWVDGTSEWFPVLAERASIGTPQGSEWLEGGFDARLRMHRALAACRDDSAACLSSVTEETATHAFVPSGCCGVLAGSMRTSPEWEVVYDAGGVLIAERR